MEPLEGKMPGTSGPESVSTKLERIAELARKAPTMAFTTLAHHIDISLLHVAYGLTRKNGATGVDGETATSYEKNLEANLRSLLERFKSGTYKAPPVKRAYIPKGDGSKPGRPIGIPTFEDKVLQRAVAMVLEAVYEQDFRNVSYGFRPGRSTHQALDALWRGVMDMNGVVLELDIQNFFGSLDHGHLRSILDRRIRDGVLRRMIDKWLKAGVFEDGAVHYPESGSPQGGVVSPILSLIFLHEVLDVWFEDVVRPRLRGPARLIRYADDVAIAFTYEDDAKRVMAVLPQRFGKYGLSLHPQKTRLVPFFRPGPQGKGAPTGGHGAAGTFDFLGFTHHWAKSLNGNWVVRRKTSRSRLQRAVKAIHAWLSRNRHMPVEEQHAVLVQKVRGHNGYYGIIGNVRATGAFVRHVERAWHMWLDRRSHRARMPWPRFVRLLKRFPLPRPRLVHRAALSVANT
jgi:group II intron reverse transcriptase/maturase